MTLSAQITIISTSMLSEVLPRWGDYTAYNLEVRLPMRCYILQRRYSEFLKLHKLLTQEVGAAPPEPLPGKRTIMAMILPTELARQRVVSLEKYLKGISQAPDSRWRETSAWIHFLRLPAVSVNKLLPMFNCMFSDVNSTSWAQRHREIGHQLRFTRKSLSRRDTVEQIDNDVLFSSARSSIVACTHQLQLLQETSQRMEEQNLLGEGELRRQKELIATVKNEIQQLEKLLSDEIKANTSSPRPSNQAVKPVNNQTILAIQVGLMEIQDLQVDMIIDATRKQRHTFEKWLASSSQTH